MSKFSIIFALIALSLALPCVLASFDFRKGHRQASRATPMRLGTCRGSLLCMGYNGYKKYYTMHFCSKDEYGGKFYSNIINFTLKNDEVITPSGKCLASNPKNSIDGVIEGTPGSKDCFKVVKYPKPSSTLRVIKYNEATEGNGFYLKSSRGWLTFSDKIGDFGTTQFFDYWPTAGKIPLMSPQEDCFKWK